MSVLGLVLGSIDVLFRKWRRAVRPKTCEWCVNSCPLDDHWVKMAEKHHILAKYSLKSVDELITCIGLSFVLRENDKCTGWVGPKKEKTPHFPPRLREVGRVGILQYI